MVPPTDPSLVYLNNAGTSWPKPEGVAVEVKRGLW
jgi:hypothetical protein